MTARTFISYRRDDSAPWTRGICEALRARLGAENVFMDVDSIAPGADFVAQITSFVATCDAAVIIIGPDWLGVGRHGGTRIAEAEDYVRLEVAEALARGVRVVPVLVGDATMPTPESLPEELEPLTRRNAIQVSHGRFEYDVGLIARAVDPDGTYELEVQRRGRRRRTSPLLILAGGAILATAGAAVALAVRPSSSPPNAGKDTAHARTSAVGSTTTMASTPNNVTGATSPPPPNLVTIVLGGTRSSVPATGARVSFGAYLTSPRGTPAGACAIDSATGATWGQLDIAPVAAGYCRLSVSISGKAGLRRFRVRFIPAATWAPTTSRSITIRVTAAKPTVLGPPPACTLTFCG